MSENERMTDTELDRLERLAFIAAARSRLPWLVRELRAERQRADNAVKTAEEYIKYCDSLRQQLETTEEDTAKKMIAEVRGYISVCTDLKTKELLGMIVAALVRGDWRQK